MTEKELRDAIVERARLAGWSATYFPKVPVKYDRQPVRWMTPVGGDGKGWLDMMFVRERVLAVEIKARKDSYDRKLPPEQQTWLDRWRIAGVRAFVWTPADLDDGTIDTELTTFIRRDPIVRPDVVRTSTGHIPGDYPGPPPEPRVSKPPAVEMRGI